jgi:hypothetical protein
MKATLTALFLIFSSYSFAQSTVITKKVCERQSFEGQERTLVSNLGEVFSFETGIDEEGFGFMSITKEDGSVLELDFVGDHGHQNAIGPTFVTGAHFGRIYPNLGLRANLRIEVGEGKHEGTLTAKKDPTCRGGYIGGCTGFSKATYSCK